ncbi:MAG: hypothetical protein DRO39_07835 [Thermoprotei archaeon]|nr:MAG: hypothetical protein DRO39_07835 [Thermoprotei archaeon]
MLRGLSGAVRRVVLLMLTDAVLWGVWFGSMWMFRPALASRLAESYSDVNLVVSIPLLVAAVVQYLAGSSEGCRRFISAHRLWLMRLVTLVVRPMNLAIALVLYLELLEGRQLLYAVAALFTLSNALGAFGGIAWSDYVGANIPGWFKPRFAGLDSMISNIGSLGGTVLAGYLLGSSHGVRDYGLVFLIGSAAYIAGLPIPFMLVETGAEEAEARMVHRSRGVRGARLYAAVSLALFAINLPMSIAVPYIMRVWRGDETWVAVINASSWIASIATPMMWSALVEKLGALRAAGLSVGLAIATNVAFPFMPTVELQGLRAFLGGAAGTGIWVTLFSFLISDVEPRYRVFHSSMLFAVQNAVPAVAMSAGAALADATGFPELVFWLSSLGLVSIPLLRSSTTGTGAPSRERTSP